jgi:hypothetical protein
MGTKKKNHQKTAQENAQETPQVTTQVEDIDEEIDPAEATYQQKTEKWAFENGATTAQLSCTCYKAPDVGRGGTKGRNLSHWDGYIPEEHEIGMIWGSGEYYYIIELHKPDGTTKFKKHNFIIDKNYDTLRREAGFQTSISRSNTQVMIPPIGGSGQIQDFISLIKEIMPLMRQESPMEQLGKFGEVLAQSMQKSLLSNIAFFKQLQTEVLPMLGYNANDDDDEDEPDGKDNTDMNGAPAGGITENLLVKMAKEALPKIMPQLASYVLRLLDPDPTKTQKIIETLQKYGITNMFSIPALNEDMKKTIAYLDNQLTAEKTTLALSKIGVDANQYR